MTAGKLKEELKKYASLERKKANKRFFKTGKGEYGEGDRFLGISNPDIRKVAEKFADLNYIELQKIISSKFNEERLCALIILVNRYKKKRTGEAEKKKIFKFLLKNLKNVNNWNLVDITAPHIMGEYLIDNRREIKILDKLLASNFHWHRRVAVLATWSFIKRGDLQLTLKIAKKLFNDKEDLMHKAVGWMLREAWKKDAKMVEKFLIKNYNKIPRTTLRYTIERMSETKRKRFLKGKFKKYLL